LRLTPFSFPFKITRGKTMLSQKLEARLKIVRRLLREDRISSNMAGILDILCCLYTTLEENPNLNIDSFLLELENVKLQR